MFNSQLSNHLKLSLLASAMCLSTMAMAQNASNGAGDEEFPDMSKSYLKTGDFVNPANVRFVELGAAPRNTMKGMNKDQIRLAIGLPHFSEGLGDNKVWNYVFNFYTPAATVAERAFVTCQFKIRFNDDSRIESTHWKDAACANLANPPAPVAVPVVAQPAAVLAPKVVAMPEKFKLSGDAVFAFNKSGIADIMSSGRAALDKLAADISGMYSKIDQINVVGHTDRIGNDSANMLLSYERAATVHQYLTSKGLAAAAIRSSGAGKTQPIVQCASNQKNAALINCLQPNRRVEIEVFGDKR